MTKYHAKRTQVDGIWFASGREASWYSQYKLLERGKVISKLELQPEFTLSANGIVIGKYRADFAYEEKGKRIIIDVKSKPTITPLYRWKLKHLRAQYPSIDHREVF